MNGSRLYRSALWYVFTNLNPIEKALAIGGAFVGAVATWVLAIVWMGLFCK